MLELELRFDYTHSRDVVEYWVDQKREVVDSEHDRAVTKPNEFLVLEMTIVFDNVFYRGVGTELFRK